jgi:sulfur relay (sulfurtransferase) DsrC/TusE family protein
MTTKKQMQNIPADHCHIEVIRLLEDYVTKYRDKPCTFFKIRNIDEVLNWSKTAHGGKQYQLFNNETISPSCQKWGMCGI